jgi:hypothetical protein
MRLQNSKAHRITVLQEMPKDLTGSSRMRKRLVRSTSFRFQLKILATQLYRSPTSLYPKRSKPTPQIPPNTCHLKREVPFNNMCCIYDVVKCKNSRLVILYMKYGNIVWLLTFTCESPTPLLRSGRTGSKLYLIWLSLRNYLVEVQHCRRITDHFRGIYGIHLNLMRKKIIKKRKKESKKITTCN